MTRSSTDSTKKHNYHVTSLESFEHLNTMNDIEWRIKRKTILDTMNAWETVTGEEKIPHQTLSDPLDKSDKWQNGCLQPSMHH